MPEIQRTAKLILLVPLLLLFACQIETDPTGGELFTRSIASPPVTTNKPTEVTGKNETSEPKTTTFTGDPWEIINPAGQTVRIWHPYTDQRQDALNQLIADFNRTNIWGIKVISESKDNFTSLYYDVLGVLNTPDSPNMVLAFQDQSSAYRMFYGLADMETLQASPKWGFSQTELDDFYGYILEHDLSSKFNNSRLGFPYFRAINVLYYNEDWLKEIGFENPPSNPEQFKEAACKSIVQPFSRTENKESQGYGITLDASTLINWAFAFGADIFDEDKGEYTFDSEETVLAARFLQELVNRDCATVYNDYPGGQNGFSEGILLFTTGTSSSIPYYIQEIEENLGFVWNITTLPPLTSNPIQNVYGPSLSILKTNREAELASWLFIKYLTMPDAQEYWAKSTYYYPVRKDTGKVLSDFTLEYPQYSAASDYFAFGKTEPSLPGYDFVRELAAESLAAIFKGMDASQILSELTIEANALLMNQDELPLSTIESIPVPGSGE